MNDYISTRNKPHFSIGSGPSDNQGKSKQFWLREDRNLGQISTQYLLCRSWTISSSSDPAQGHYCPFQRAITGSHFEMCDPDAIHPLFDCESNIYYAFLDSQNQSHNQFLCFLGFGDRF
jgi:hypothetical protein